MKEVIIQGAGHCNFEVPRSCLLFSPEGPLPAFLYFIVSAVWLTEVYLHKDTLLREKSVTGQM